MKPRLLGPLIFTILLIALGAIASACGGGNDSDIATDGNADDRSSEGDGSSSSSSGSTVPLYASDVSDFSKGVVIGSAGQLEAANRALDRAIDSGQQVIVCQYGPSDPEAQTGYTNYGFWYEDVPDNIDELLLVARDSGVPVPVSSIGTNAISSCPDSRDEGRAAWQETPIESVFPLLSGNWDNNLGPGYLHFKFLFTDEDSDEDIYDFSDYNTSRGVPVFISEGTLAVDSDGNGYMEGSGDPSCLQRYGGAVTLSSPDDFTGDLTCLSNTGEYAGGDITIRYTRRR